MSERESEIDVGKQKETGEQRGKRKRDQGNIGEQTWLAGHDTEAERKGGGQRQSEGNVREQLLAG